jgi:lysozyme
LAQDLHVKISDKGLELIKNAEGLRLKSYLCPAGVWTIGYGHTGRDVTKGMIITREEAAKLLTEDVARFEVGVSEVINKPMTQGQFDALVDFAFNLGLGALRGSTLAAKFKAGDIAGASREISKWVWGGGRMLPGLVKRREAARALFDSV